MEKGLPPLLLGTLAENPGLAAVSGCGALDSRLCSPWCLLTHGGVERHPRAPPARCQEQPLVGSTQRSPDTAG